MAETDKSRQASLSRRGRTFQVVVAMGLLALLIVAGFLTPDRHGHGTHQQLGLPPCTFVVLFGRPCPSCGMTTSWAWLVRGRLVEAFQANAGGALLGILAAVSAVWLLLSATGGRWFAWKPDATAILITLVLIGVVTLLQWGHRLMTF